MPAPRFRLGQTVITPKAKSTLHPEDIPIALARHAARDWGEVSEADREQNNVICLMLGLRIRSVYKDRAGVEFWVITEEDRSATIVLLPEDYRSLQSLVP